MRRPRAPAPRGGRPEAARAGRGPRAAPPRGPAGTAWRSKATGGAAARGETPIGGGDSWLSAKGLQAPGGFPPGELLA